MVFCPNFLLFSACAITSLISLIPLVTAEKSINLEIIRDDKSIDGYIKFLIINTTSTVCTFESSTRKIKAKAVGDCNLRANIKSGQKSYISTPQDILIHVQEQQSNDEIFATNIQKLKDNLILSVSQNVDVYTIFNVLPINCTQNIEISFENTSLCSFDVSTHSIISNQSGSTKMTAKILADETNYLTSEIFVIVCDSQTQFSFQKELTFDENEENTFILYITNDVPELESYGQIDFQKIYNQDDLQIIETEINILKIKCTHIGSFDFVLSNAGYLITYTLIANQNVMLNISTNTNAINLTVGDVYSLNNIAYQDLPENYQIEYSVQNQIAEISNDMIIANNIGNSQLVVTINFNFAEQIIYIPLNITTKSVEYNLSYPLSQEYAIIDLYQDPVVANISPTFLSTDIQIQNTSLLTFENLDNSTLTISLIKKGIITITFNISCYTSGPKAGQMCDHGTTFKINEGDLEELFFKLI